MATTFFSSSAVSSPDQLLDLVNNILESSTEHSIIGLDLDGTIVLWNEGARRLYGYEAEELLGKAHCSLLHVAEDVQAGKPRQILDTALRDGKWEGLVDRLRKDGQSFTARLVITLRRDISREAVGFLLISKDNAYETGVARAEEMFRGLLESAPDAMVIVDKAGAIVLVNSQTEKLFGYERRELLGCSIETLVPGRLGDKHAVHGSCDITKPPLQPTGAGLDLYGVRKDGTEFPVEVSLSPLTTDEGTLVSRSIRDITERKNFERVLREKNQAFVDASLVKNRFLASMSHALRTPLNAVIGFTGTLLMRLPGPLTADQEKQLRTVQASARHLLSLINDLLDLAKIESGEVELHLEPVILQSVVEEVATGLRPLAEGKGLCFHVAAPDYDLVLRTDRQALSRILTKLADNAIKFTQTGGVRIELGRCQTGRQILTQIHVVDTGIGIRPEDGNRLFQTFPKVASAIRERPEGTGLSLHLSRMLAELLGSRISVQSEHGRGSTFSVTWTEEIL